jgi:hypothetical protein
MAGSASSDARIAVNRDDLPDVTLVLNNLLADDTMLLQRERSARASVPTISP